MSSIIIKMNTILNGYNSRIGFCRLPPLLGFANIMDGGGCICKKNITFKNVFQALALHLFVD